MHMDCLPLKLGFKSIGYEEDKVVILKGVCKWEKIGRVTETKHKLN